MSIKHALLAILAEGDRHGYELKATFDERIGEFWSLNFGQIYSTLDRLEKDGLVSHDRETQDRRPDRKIFTITPQGREEVTRWLATPVVRPRALRDEFFIKMVFLAKEDPHALLALIEQQKMLAMQQMGKLTQKKLRLKKGTGTDALTGELLADAALFHTEADIRWLTLCEAKLRASLAMATPNGG